MTDDEKAHALRAIAEDADLVRQMFFRFGPDDKSLIPFAQENVRAAAEYIERRDLAVELPTPDRLVERVALWGVPATIVAQAFATLPGDERVSIPLELSPHLGTPVLKLRAEKVRDAIDQRHLDHPGV